ncbi:MAG: ACP S-malonyltransferase [Rubrobacteraceae bacterium]
MRRAVVFPGQGTAGGEVSGVVRDAVRRVVGDEEVPYQLSVFARSAELYGELRETGMTPDFVAGHSLGEYAAACAAGSLGLEDGVRLVAERDRLMNEASQTNPGGMIALIGADPREVEQAVREQDGVVVAANFNTPRQTVISGEEAAMEAVASGVGGKSRALKVAGAFHSPLMVEAAAGMELMLAETEFEEPEVPMVSAMDGGILETADDVRTALQRQMLSPVRWVAVIGRLVDMEVGEVIEAGDDGTLTRMLRDFKDIELEGRTAKEALA